VAEPLSGAQAEGLACAYLERAGLRLLARNYRCPQGEIDLVMDDRDTLVFVEVRYRRSNAFGTPAETVDRRKHGAPSTATNDTAPTAPAVSTWWRERPRRAHQWLRDAWRRSLKQSV
jgi:putative endonuclease